MKSKELIKIFDLCGQILSHYKDKDVAYALTDILKKCNPDVEVLSKKAVTTKKTTTTKKEPVKYANNEFLTEIQSMNLQDIRTKLNNKDEFPNMESLRSLAASFGLGKQLGKKDDIIHSIIKIIERSRIDKTISERQLTIG
jgi:hypothetical protein